MSKHELLDRQLYFSVGAAVDEDAHVPAEEVSELFGKLFICKSQNLFFSLFLRLMC